MTRLCIWLEDRFCTKSIAHDFPMRGEVAKITDIPTDAFASMVRELRRAGWRKIQEYDAFDAWIDYGLIILERDGAVLKCEWTNWEEGSFHGPPEIIEPLRSRLHR